MGTREVYEEKLRRGNLYHEPTINPGLGSPRCPRCLSLINSDSVRCTPFLSCFYVIVFRGLSVLLLTHMTCSINFHFEYRILFTRVFRCSFRTRVSGLSLPFYMMPPPLWVSPFFLCFFVFYFFDHHSTEVPIQGSHVCSLLNFFVTKAKVSCLMWQFSLILNYTLVWWQPFGQLLLICWIF